jgi:hypothetical protein
VEVSEIVSDAEVDLVALSDSDIESVTPFDVENEEDGSLVKESKVTDSNSVPLCESERVHVAVDECVWDRECDGDSDPLGVVDRLGESSEEPDGVSEMDPERRCSVPDHVRDTLDRDCRSVSVNVMDVDSLPDADAAFDADGVNDLALKDNRSDKLGLNDDDDEYDTLRE